MCIGLNPLPFPIEGEIDAFGMDSEISTPTTDWGMILSTLDSKQVILPITELVDNGNLDAAKIALLEYLNGS